MSPAGAIEAAAGVLRTGRTGTRIAKRSSAPLRHLDDGVIHLPIKPIRTGALTGPGASIRLVLVLAAALCPARASAQAAPPAAPNWTVSASAGLAVTSGNADTSTVNVSYEATYGRQMRNLIKSDGLMIRGKRQGELSADRRGLNVRNEFRVNDHAYLFGENRYLRDRFKNIEYLLAPSAGLGYKVVDRETTRLSFDVGVGGVWEKNSDIDATDQAVTASGSVTIGERYEQALTATTSIVQSYSGLWRTQDLSDSLHVLGITVGMAVSSHIQFKVELLDTYKSRPPATTAPAVSIRKNDVAILFGLAYSI